MIIKRLLNKLEINKYSYILLFISLLTGLFKEIVIVYIIVIIHEIGHVFVSKIFRWKLKKIVLYPFGGMSIYDDLIDKDLKEEFLVTISGPLFQILFFLLINYLYKNYYLNYNDYIIFKNYHYSILIFNILPLIPLDGSKILNIFLNKIFNFRISYDLTNIICTIFLLLFVINNFNYSYLLLITFLLYELINIYKNKKYIINKFILEKSLYKSNYKKYKTIFDKKNMYRNKKNIIKNKDIFISENHLLR